MTDNNLAMTMANNNINNNNNNNNGNMGNFTLPMVKKYHNMVFIMKKIYDITTNSNNSANNGIGKILKKESIVGKGKLYKNKDNNEKKEI